ncbi:Hexokinase-3 [Hibiscus syriacus]|uniref:Phosphotransferase n=1 Tax=Hibiscus syriacus TaxID=106335 RepID=A0A6A3CSX8_HIBSY|nr:Hexokinase-3 [Hibiscus syriacus]
MTGRSEDLFDFIASSLHRFVGKGNDSVQSSVTKELGFTFSFTVKKTSVSSGVLIKWTKAFAIKNMVGKEVAGALQQALARKGLNMRVAVLVNDTVGTLALGCYHDADTVAAVIIGTGTNACYWERTDAIIKCQGLLTTSRCMVVNMERGNFLSSHLPRTSYDIELDAESPNPNDQGFEKMISGMYLGDIVRRVILRMSEELDIFGPVSPRLYVPFALRAPAMTAMHEDDSPELSEVAKILKDILDVIDSNIYPSCSFSWAMTLVVCQAYTLALQIPDVPLKSRKLVVKICDVVTRRAAQLVAAGIVGVLKKIGRDGSSGITGGRSRSDIKMRRMAVDVEGSIYTQYTTFRDYLHEALHEILGEDIARHVVISGTERIRDRFMGIPFLLEYCALAFLAHSLLGEMAKLLAQSAVVPALVTSGSHGLCPSKLSGKSKRL